MVPAATDRHGWVAGHMPVGAVLLGETATAPRTQGGEVSHRRGNVADFLKALVATADWSATDEWQDVAAATGAR